jgi:hypothetical protein
MNFGSLSLPALLLLAATTLHAQTTLPSPPTVADSLGVNIHFTTPKPGEMEMLAAGGFHWVRMDMLWNQSWSATERAKGVYDFSACDGLLAALKPHGIRTIFILAYGNPLYDKGLSPHTDEGRQAYARWAAAAAKHFAGRAILWETWNEPNGRLFWKPTPNAEDYAQLAVAVGKAFQQSVPDEALVGPALAKFDWPFIETCFKAGVLNYWSAVTVHPYRDSDPETVAADYRKLRRLIDQYAPPGKRIPIISGEWGYFLKLGPDATPERQGKLLARQWLTNLANEIPLSIWYDWHDDGTDPKNVEHNLGTVANAYHKGREPVYDPKPAYLAAKTLTTCLNGHQFNKRLIVDSPDDYVLLFEKEGDIRLAAWTAGQPHDLTIPATPGPFAVTTWTGDAAPDLTADPSGLTLHLTDAPQYLVPRHPNDLLAIAAAWQTLPLDITATAPATVQVKTQLKNPTDHPIHLKPSTGAAIDLASGQTTTFSLPVQVLRSESPQPLRLALQVGDAAPFVQQAHLAAHNPLNLTALPTGERTITVHAQNPTGQPFTGALSLAATGPTPFKGSAPLRLKQGDRDQSVTIQTDQPVPPRATLTLTVTDDAGRTVAQSTRAYSRELADTLEQGAWVIKSGGDPKVNSQQSMTPAAPPQPSPAGPGPVFKITYQFDAGGKYLWLMPTKSDIRPITGRPIALGLWIYGDGVGNRPVLRFKDSTGQTFQPTAPVVDWTGWRYIEFSLDDGAVWHYGGANDGVIHYPLQWDTLFLFDTVRRDKPSAGTIYLSAPILLWDSPPQ